MDITKTAASAAIQLSDTLEKISAEQANALIEVICDANKIYVYGAGRSMMMLRCLAMRLMHLGFESYVVGDTITPAFEKGDLLIVGSGSGETGSLINIASKAKKLKGKIAVITINRESALGKMSDVLVEIPAYTDKVDMDETKKPILPGGSMFEQSMLLLFDTMVLPLGEKANISTDHYFSRHANLE